MLYHKKIINIQYFSKIPSLFLFQLTKQQLLSEPVMRLLPSLHNVVLVESISAFELAQKKKVKFLLPPTGVASLHFAALIRE